MWHDLNWSKWKAVKLVSFHIFFSALVNQNYKNGTGLEQDPVPKISSPGGSWNSKLRAWSWKWAFGSVRSSSTSINLTLWITTKSSISISLILHVKRNCGWPSTWQTFIFIICTYINFYTIIHYCSAANNWMSHNRHDKISKRFNTVSNN